MKEFHTLVNLVDELTKAIGSKFRINDTLGAVVSQNGLLLVLYGGCFQVMVDMKVKLDSFIRVNSS